MKLTNLAATACALLMSASLPANAIDCATASKHVEKMICSNAKLKAADTALNAAYAKLLRSTTDREAHDLIVASQRRWLKVRDGEFDGRRDDEADRSTEEPNDEEALLLKAIEDRKEHITGSRTFPNLAEIIKKARADSAMYTGGPYARYETECWFAPRGFGDGVYFCLGTQTFQNQTRICRSSTVWASGHETEYRTVANATENGVKMIATCAIGYAATNEQCPEPGLDKSRWNMKPVATKNTPDFTGSSANLMKYDPDVTSITSEPWLRECLVNPNYPAAEPHN